MRPIAALLLVLSGWTLACAGGDVPAPVPAPVPTPPPDPKPEPAPDAGACADFQGVSLPLSGGVITACSPAAVTIDHADGDPKSLRWDYAEAYKRSGWQQADPVDNSPAVTRPPATLVFENTDKAVVIRCQGCDGGGGERPGRPDRPPGRPGRPGR